MSRLDDIEDRTQGLAALFYCILDQAHPAEFARDKYTIDGGFEIGFDHGNVDTARRGTEDKFNCADRTHRLAGTVSDTVSRTDQPRLVLDHAKDRMCILFGTCGHA